MTDYERACKVVPSGSLTRSKAPGRFYPLGAGPHYCARGHGAYLVAADGSEYLDMLCALGAISLGYGVTGMGAMRAIRDGGIYSLPSTLEAEAAEVMLAHVAPWAARVKFTKTGSESTHAAYRIAKHATGRPLVVTFADAYHGWYEWSWRGPDGVPESPFTRLAPYGVDLEAWTYEQQLDPSKIAAVFVEPHRWQATPMSWLAHVREFCTAHGIVFVLDEMIYGGRWALGGASAFFGVTPDLACYGKALGNGAAIAAVVGSADLVETAGGMVSGTFSGDTVGLAALIEVVGAYARTPVIETLWHRGDQLAGGLRAACARHPALGAVVEGAGNVHLRVRFADPAHGPAFSAQMVRHGILWHPDCTNVCASHTAAMMAWVVEAADASMAALVPSRAAFDTAEIGGGQ